VLTSAALIAVSREITVRVQVVNLDGMTASAVHRKGVGWAFHKIKTLRAMYPSSQAVSVLPAVSTARSRCH